MTSIVGNPHEEMVTNIIVSYNKKDAKIQILEAEDSEDKKETVVEEKDLSKFIYEINLEAFVYYQQFDYTYSLYLLKKADKVLTVGVDLRGFRGIERRGEERATRRPRAGGQQYRLPVHEDGHLRQEHREAH
jgi:hypothetical protein